MRLPVPLIFRKRRKAAITWQPPRMNNLVFALTREGLAAYAHDDAIPTWVSSYNAPGTLSQTTSARQPRCDRTTHPRGWPVASYTAANNQWMESGTHAWSEEGTVVLVARYPAAATAHTWAAGPSGSPKVQIYGSATNKFGTHYHNVDGDVYTIYSALNYGAFHVYVTVHDSPNYYIRNRTDNTWGTQPTITKLLRTGDATRVNGTDLWKATPGTFKLAELYEWNVLLSVDELDDLVSDLIAMHGVEP